MKNIKKLSITLITAAMVLAGGTSSIFADGDTKKHLINLYSETIL